MCLPVAADRDFLVPRSYHAGASPRPLDEDDAYDVKTRVLLTSLGVSVTRNAALSSRMFGGSAFTRFEPTKPWRDRESARSAGPMSIPYGPEADPLGGIPSRRAASQCRVPARLSDAKILLAPISVDVHAELYKLAPANNRLSTQPQPNWNAGTTPNTNPNARAV